VWKKVVGDANLELRIATTHGGGLLRERRLYTIIIGLNLSSADSQRELQVRRMHHVQVLSFCIPLDLR
jgi:hypothetical protein